MTKRWSSGRFPSAHDGLVGGAPLVPSVAGYQISADSGRSQGVISVALFITSARPVSVKIMQRTPIGQSPYPDSSGAYRSAILLRAGQCIQQYCHADATMCLPLADYGADVGASAFVNSMNSPGFAENSPADGQEAILHTVGASNLGRTLARIYAKQVVNVFDDNFMALLTDAICANGSSISSTKLETASWSTRSSAARIESRPRRCRNIWSITRAG